MRRAERSMTSGVNWAPRLAGGGGRGMDVKAQVIRRIRRNRKATARVAKEKAAMGARAASIRMSVKGADCSMSAHYA